MFSCIFLAVTGRRQISSGRQSTRLIAQLKDAVGSFGMLTETSLAALAPDELMAHLLGRLCQVLETDVAVVLIRDRARPQQFDFLASHGLDIGRLRPLEVTPEQGLIGSIVADLIPRTVNDASRIDLLSSQLGRRFASAAGCPIVVSGQLIAICVVGASAARRFEDPHLQLLQLVADRVGVELERVNLSEARDRSSAAAERARRHAVMLAQASEVLLTAEEDYDENLLALVDVIVPAFADRCQVELCGIADGRRAFPAQSDPRMRSADIVLLEADVLASGNARSSNDDRTVVAAIRIGAAMFGTMTLDLAPERPVFDDADLSVASELATRAAITIERVLRYRDAWAVAQASLRRAGQLQQLVEAAIDVQQLREEPEVILRMAERARQVFGWSRAPIIARNGSGAGTVAIRPVDVELTVDDQAILGLLAEMASTALDNAQLYRSIATSEERWRVLVEAAPIGILEVDLSGEVLWWNRAATAIFAWPEPQQRPAKFEGFPEVPGQVRAGSEGPSFPAETAAGLRTLWSEVVGGQQVVERELASMAPDGDVHELAVSAAPLVSSGGNLQGMLTLVADVTDRHRLEGELRRAQRMEAIGQLAGGVAHDFNNLLTLVTGYSDLLERRLDGDQRSLELVDGVRSAITRASLLTGQLLTISRLQTAHPIVVAPVDTLRSVAEVLERILGGAVELHWALDPDAGKVSMAPGQLEQVILNLAINARDAMPDGGRLDIAVSSVQREPGPSDDFASGPYVRIVVTDTGLGMDAETRRRCFEPLFTTKGPSRGTGLGLAAVKGVVTDSGGEVLVESRPGQGTTFTVYLPSVAETPAGEIPSGEAPAGGIDGGGIGAVGPRSGDEKPAVVRTILLAEDDEVVRRLMSRVLTRDGYQVLEAADGCQALSVAEGWSGTIDALVTDVVMPGMRGPEVAAAVRATRPSMRVLFVSGGTENSDPVALPPDAAYFMAKPFKPSQLVARVGTLLED